jgi:energy-coupling factor transporter ATP-binding protein EcfA2
MFLNVSQLSVRYPGAAQPAVDGVSLGLRAGDIGVLIGPSGCGKTTLLRAVAGLERARAAASRWAGEMVSTPAPRAGRAAPHRHGVPGLRAVPHLDVGRNVAFGIAHLPRAERERACGRGAGAGGAGRPAGALPARALGRPAAARGPGPRAGAQPAPAAAGRTVFQPRRGPARAPGARGARHPQGRRRHRPVRHARPARSLCHRRRDRRDARGPPAPVGRRLRALPPPGHALRGRIHRPRRVRAGPDPAGATRWWCRPRWAPCRTWRNAPCPAPTTPACATCCCAPTTSCTTTTRR